jgi:hypothetical protein
MKIRTLELLAIAAVLATRAVPQVITEAPGIGGPIPLASPANVAAQPLDAPAIAAPDPADAKPDLSPFDVAAVEPQAMPTYRIVEHPVPLFRSRDLYTEDGMAAQSFRAHPGLHVGNAFNLNRKAAREFFLEDDWRATKSDYWNMAHAMALGGDHGEGRMILEEINDEDMRMRAEAEEDAAAPTPGRFQIASAETGTRLLEMPEQPLDIPFYRRTW